jgi:hypothetical protein
VTVSNIVLTRFCLSIRHLSFTERGIKEDDHDKDDDASLIDQEDGNVDGIEVDDKDEDEDDNGDTKDPPASKSKDLAWVPGSVNRLLSGGHSISASEITCSPSTSSSSEASTAAVAAFVQHETSLGNIPDLKKAREEVAEVVRSKLFRSNKFTQREEMFEYVPRKDADEPMRGVLYRTLLVECKHRGGNDTTWWDAVKKVVKTAISKKRTTVTMALKKAFIGK